MLVDDGLQLMEVDAALTVMGTHRDAELYSIAYSTKAPTARTMCRLPPGRMVLVVAAVPPTEPI